MELLISATQSGRTVRLALRGDIDLATAGQIRDAVIATLATSAPERIILDLRLVSFIDSTGIGALVVCHKSAAIAGATLQLDNLSPFARRQLWATGLLGLFGFPTMDASEPQVSRQRNDARQLKDQPKSLERDQRSHHSSPTTSPAATTRSFR